MARITKVAIAIMAIWIVLISTICSAWEFSSTGAYVYNFTYLTQGPDTFFGNRNVAQSAAGTGLTSIGLPGPVNGAVVVEGLSSKGGDGSYNTEKLFFINKLSVNPAVSLNFKYSFQGSLNGLYQGGPNWSNPAHYAGSWFSNARTEEASNAITTGFLNWAYASVRMPFGNLYVGRRPLAFGPGWSGFHVDDSALFLVGLEVPYGPLTFFMGQDISSTGEYSDPFDTRNINLNPLTVASPLDRNEVQKWSSFYSIDFRNGPVATGIGARAWYWQNAHAWPQGSGTLRDDRTDSVAKYFLNTFRSFQTQGTGGNQQTVSYPVYGDFLLITLPIYFQYNNGRVFANLEWDQQYLKADRQGGRPISGYPRSWFVEIGAYSGPAKLSLIGAYRSGHDRQGGLLDVTSTTGTSQTTAVQVGDTWNQWIPFGGGHAPLDPYNFLIGYYGAGNNQYDKAGYPTYVDFFGLGGRADFAVAANLNVYASYLYAKRASNTGVAWGQFGGGAVADAIRGANVPNNFIGQELDLGISWKLLDSFTAEVKGAAWKPGPWFKHAYADATLLSGINDPVSGVASFINPNRSLDPVLGFQTTLRIDF